MKILSFILAFLIVSSSLVFGATIHGVIYNMDLEKVSNTVVEVNSTPKQRLVSTNGTYAFNLPQGDYTISAAYNDGSNYQKAEEKISVKDDGDYVLDLFLFPDISAEEELFNESDIMINVPYKKNYLPYYIFSAVALLFFIAFLLYRALGKKRVENIILKKEDTDLEKLVMILKKHGGRATQKDIRKEIPLSEAKISLMISELESEGRLKKIRKGRGNILVLQQLL